MPKIKPEMKKFVHSRWKENEVNPDSLLEEASDVITGSKEIDDTVSVSNHEAGQKVLSTNTKETSNARNLFDDVFTEKRRLVRKKSYPRRRYRGKDMRLQALKQLEDGPDENVRIQNDTGATAEDDGDSNIFQRPQSTYSVLISEAFVSEKSSVLSVQNIVRLLKKKYPYFYTVKSLVNCVNQALQNCKKFEKVSPAVWSYNDTTPLKLKGRTWRPGSNSLSKQKHHEAKSERPPRRRSQRTRSRKRPEFLNIEWNKESKGSSKKSKLHSEGMDKNKKHRSSAGRQHRSKYDTMSPPNCENDEIVVKSEPSDDVQEYYFADNSRSHSANRTQMSESQSKERIMEYNKKVLADAINKIIEENEKCLKDLGLLPETPESEVVQDKKNNDEQPANTVTNSKSNEQSGSKSADTTCRSKEQMMKYNSEILAETINKVIMENEKCLKSLGLLRDDEQTSGISSGAEREDERKKEEDTHKSSVNEDFNTPIERSRKLLKNAIQDVISEGESGAQETTALTDKHERSPDDFRTLDLSMRKSSKSCNEFASTSQFQKIVNNPSQRACSSENIHSACALPHTGNTRGYHVRHGKRIFPRFNGSRDQQQPCNSKDLDSYCEPTFNKHFKSKRNNLHNCKPVDLSLDEKVDKNTEVQSLNPDKMEESVACFHDKDDDTKKVTSPNSSIETMKMPIDTCDDLNSDSPFDSSDEAMIENAFAEFAQKNSELDDIVALIDPMLVSGRSSQETSSSVLDNTFKNLFDFINEDTRDAGNWHDDVNRTSPDLLCSEKMKDSPDKDTSHSGECIDVSDDENNPMATQNICTQTSPEFVKPSSLKSPVTPKINSVFSITKERNRFTAAKSSLDLEETSSSSLQQVNVIGISPSEKVGKVTKLTMQYKPDANCLAKKKTKKKKSSKSKGNKVNENQSRYISINRPPYQQCLNTPRHTHTSYRYVPPYQWKVRIGAAPQPEVAKSPIYVTPMYVANTHQRHQVHAPLPNPTGSRFYTIGNSVHVGTSELQPTRFVVPNNRNDVRYRIRGANVFRFPTS